MTHVKWLGDWRDRLHNIEEIFYLKAVQGMGDTLVKIIIIKNSLKLGKASLHRPPMDQIFWRNCSMSHCFKITSIFCVLQFLRKIQNSHHF